MTNNVTTVQQLLDYSPEIFEINEANGFWDMGVENRSFGEHIALVHSEVSEALEADRKNLNDDKLTEYLGRDVELADVAIRVLDWIGANKIALELGTLITMQPKFSEYAAELHAAITVWYFRGRDNPELPLTILEYIVRYVNENNVPFIDIIEKKLAVNRARGYKHGGKSY